MKDNNQSEMELCYSDDYIIQLLGNILFKITISCHRYNKIWLIYRKWFFEKTSHVLQEHNLT